ncbi:MAG: CHASE2 domain-containing protein, partial [Planctomycetota bacterium]
MTPSEEEKDEKKGGKRGLPRHGETWLPIALGAALTLLAILLWTTGTFGGLERLAYDKLFDLRHSLHGHIEEKWQTQAEEELVIVEYDDVSTSLLRIKGTPPRKYFSKVIERTTGLAKVVAFDYYFPRESYPDSRTAEIDKNVRIWLVRLLYAMKDLQLDPGSPRRGLSQLSKSQFLTDMGFFREPDKEELEGIDIDRWAAFKNEIVRRQEETAGAVVSGEKELDEALKELDPGFVAFLDHEGQDIEGSLVLRRLS